MPTRAPSAYCSWVTKANITMNVWKYIRVNKLDGGEDARKARCDTLMKQVCCSTCPIMNKTNQSRSLATT